MTKRTANRGDHDAPRSSREVLRRIATGLGIPPQFILDKGCEDTRHGVTLFGVNSAAGVPEGHVGSAPTPEDATALSRDIRRVAAQQQAHGPWAPLRTLVCERLVDFFAGARRGLRSVGAGRLRRRGDVR